MSSDQISASRGGSVTFPDKELPFGSSGEHKNRVLSAADEDDMKDHQNENQKLIEQVISRENSSDASQQFQSKEENKDLGSQQITDTIHSEKPEKDEKHSEQIPTKKVDLERRQIPSSDKQSATAAIPDARVRHLRDQLIRAKVYLGLGSTWNNPHFIRELRLRIKDVQQALGVASKDSDLPKKCRITVEATDARDDFLINIKGTHSDYRGETKKKIQPIFHARSKR